LKQLKTLGGTEIQKRKTGERASQREKNKQKRLKESTVWAHLILSYFVFDNMKNIGLLMILVQKAELL
jgi:hypothetical protein